MAKATLSFNLTSTPEIKTDFEKAMKKASKATGLRLTNAQTLAMVLTHYLDEPDEQPQRNGNSPYG